MSDHRIRPPADVARIPFEIIRVGKARTLEFICLSDVPLVLAVHWIGSRAIRCPESDCSYCLDGKPQRWRGYVFGQSMRNPRVAIVEYTGGVGGAIADEYEHHGSLRGSHIILSRKGNRKNGPLSVEFGAANRKPKELPEVPDLFPIICRIYDCKERKDLADGQVTSTVSMRARHA